MENPIKKSVRIVVTKDGSEDSAKAAIIRMCSKDQFKDLLSKVEDEYGKNLIRAIVKLGEISCLYKLLKCISMYAQNEDMILQTMISFINSEESHKEKKGLEAKKKVLLGDVQNTVKESIDVVRRRLNDEEDK